MNFLFKNEVVSYDFFNKQKEETILFLHGWGGNKFSFEKTINLTKQNHNILTLTFPTTEPTISVWTMFDYVNLVLNILKLHSINNPIIVCHSFGFRVAMLLNKKIKIKKIIITGGAGLTKNNIFLKIIKNNNKIILKNSKFSNLFKKIASNDYLNLSRTNKQTFKNIVNLNLKFATKFNSPMLLFWGKNDTATPTWIAKKLKKENKATLYIVNDNHFAYLNKNTFFNNKLLNFLKEN
jgi:pimeloyl-ACP methyl ester carboxylesterase